MKELLKIFLGLIILLILLDLSVGFLQRKKEPIISENNSYIQPLDCYTPSMVADLYWGEEEIYGSSHNSKIVEMLNYFANWITDDETAWCSAFVSFTSARAGYEHTGKLNARSWLDIGISVIDDPKPGDIVVLWRVSRQSWKGHVAYFVRYSDDKSKVFLKGGNQSNEVTVSSYDSSRILDIRRTIKIIQEVPESGYILKLKDETITEK